MTQKIECARRKSGQQAYLERYERPRQVGREGRVLFLVSEHLTRGLVLVDGEVQAVFLEDFDRALRLKRVELTGDFASSSAENLELSALKKIVEVGALADEFLEKDTAFLNKLSVLSILSLHLGDVGTHG